MSRNLCKKIPAFLLANVLYTAFLVASLSAYSTASTYQYPLSCNDCHGMPPIDAAYRNTSSGGFKGSHLTHNPPSVAPKEACEKCHPGSSIYTSGHMNGFINLTSNINSSPHLSKATYSKARFFNQTSNPIMATCSNVNCHFENTTSTWGSDPGETTCSTCHEAPPTDGSHLPHLAFACVACHPDHTVETQPFSHATSVGSRPILLQFVTAPNSGGEYSGNVSYPYYLSSQDPARNGTCQNIYCHSNGRGGTANVSPVWGGMLAVNCSGCHGTSSAFGAPGYPNGLPHANSHGKHVHSAADCDACHTGTTTSGTVINSGSLLHLDGGIDVTFNSAKAGSGATWTAGTSTCSAISCHSDGTSVATGEITASYGVVVEVLPAIVVMAFLPPMSMDFPRPIVISAIASVATPVTPVRPPTAQMLPILSCTSTKAITWRRAQGYPSPTPSPPREAPVATSAATTTAQLPGGQP